MANYSQSKYYPAPSPKELRDKVERHWESLAGSQGYAPGCETCTGDWYFPECEYCGGWVQERMDSYDKMSPKQQVERALDLGIDARPRKKIYPPGKEEYRLM